MSLRTGGRDALEDTETPNPDVLEGLQKAYLATDNESVERHVGYSWQREMNKDMPWHVMDAEIRAWRRPEPACVCGHKERDHYNGYQCTCRNAEDDGSCRCQQFIAKRGAS